MQRTAEIFGCEGVEWVLDLKRVWNVRFKSERSYRVGGDGRKRGEKWKDKVVFAGKGWANHGSDFREAGGEVLHTGNEYRSLEFIPEY